MRIIATPCLTREIQAGELFSNVGPAYWDRCEANGSLGERVYIRTNNPALSAAEDNDITYRITIVQEESNGALV